jgi:hypothetical protein
VRERERESERSIRIDYKLRKLFLEIFYSNINGFVRHLKVIVLNKETFGGKTVKLMRNSI